MLQCILLKTTVITEGYILVERLDRNFTNILYWLEITVSTLALEFTIFHLRGVNFNISTHLLIRGNSMLHIRYKRDLFLWM